MLTLYGTTWELIQEWHGKGEKYMALFENIPIQQREPDYIVPLTPNLNNNIYFDVNSTDTLNLFTRVAEFVSIEFTKVKFVFDNVPNKARLDYLLNLNPNKEQTGNQLLYEFAVGILKNGRVYYKIEKPADAKAVKSISFSRVNQNGFKEFKYPQLKLRLPSNLTTQYADLITKVATAHTSGAVMLKSKLKGENTLDPSERNQAMENRLKVADEQIKNHGKFFAYDNEEATVLNNIVSPDSVALNDLKTLIYEHMNISPKMLSGSYSEEDYRAFYAKQLQPLIGALEELLNSEIVDYETYSAGGKISVILDLMQFATLESFTKMAKEALYSGYLTADEIRRTLGKEDYDAEFGKLIYSNKNAVILNNPELNAKVATGGENANESNQTDDNNATE